MMFIFEFIRNRFRQTWGLALELVKLRVASFYVSVVEHGRRAFITGLLVAFGIVLAMCGFLLIHVGLFLIVPWGIPVKALILLGLGVVYLVVPLVLVLKLGSHRTWMKFSHADELVGSLTKRKVRSQN